MSFFHYFGLSGFCIVLDGIITAVLGSLIVIPFSAMMETNEKNQRITSFMIQALKLFVAVVIGVLLVELAATMFSSKASVVFMSLFLLGVFDAMHMASLAHERKNHLAKNGEFGIEEMERFWSRQSNLICIGLFLVWCYSFFVSPSSLILAPAVDFLLGITKHSLWIFLISVFGCFVIIRFAFYLLASIIISIFIIKNLTKS